MAPTVRQATGTVYSGYYRPAFAGGQILAPTELNALGEYSRDKLLAALRFLAGPGVAAGLSVAATSPAGASVTIQPGFAVDGAGHDLFLRETATIALTDVLADAQACGKDETVTVALLVRHAEQTTELAACDPQAWRTGRPVTVRVLEGLEFYLRRSREQAAQVDPGRSSGCGPSTPRPCS